MAVGNAERGRGLARLLCRLGRHEAAPPVLRNRDQHFARCARCGCDLVRTLGPWHAPRGFRIVWPDDPAAPPDRHEVAASTPPDERGEAESSEIRPDVRREQATQALLAIIESLGNAEPAPMPAMETSAPPVDSVPEPREPAPPVNQAPPPIPPVASPPPALSEPAPSKPDPRPAPAPPAAKQSGIDFMSDDDSDTFDWEGSPRPAPRAAAPRREPAGKAEHGRRNLLAGEVPRG